NPAVQCRSAETGDLLERIDDAPVRRRLEQLDVDRIAPQLALEVIWATGRDNTATIDDGQVRGEPVRLLEVVRRQKDRHRLFPREPLDLRPERCPHLRIEPGGRLVEEQDLRPVQQAHGDVEPPLHSSGVRPDRTVGGLAEAEALEQLVGALAELAASDAIEGALEDEVLTARRLFSRARALADHADGAADQ